MIKMIMGAYIDEGTGAVDALSEQERIVRRLCDDAVSVVAAVLVDVRDGSGHAADDFNSHPEDRQYLMCPFAN